MRLEDVLDELRKREPIFHRPELGFARGDFEAMTAPGYWEVGASGTIYSRDFVLDELERRYVNGPPPESWMVSDFACRHLGADTFLVTYHLVQDGRRHTRRATIWEFTEGRWRIVYHQGTLIAPD